MDGIVKGMLSGRPVGNEKEVRNSLREVLQEIALYGLSEAGFFKEGVFCGDTASRMFHGLDRYSEDLDFSLISPEDDFDFGDFVGPLTDTFEDLGVCADVKVKENALLLDLVPNEMISDIYQTDTIKVKMELDTEPSGRATFEKKVHFQPHPHYVCLFDESSLFAGKIHAILCRNWGNRFKGRDLYDLVFYVSKNTPVNLESLKARLVQTGTLGEDEELDIGKVRSMLTEKMDCIDFDTAKGDVIPFVRDGQNMKIWGREFFIDTIERIG